jgi:hypothetical protein
MWRSSYMINFNNGKERLNRYLGSEVKTTILYDNDIYMIKYPDPVREKKNELSYMNNQYSEHIGSLIFKLCGFDVQETVLGYFNDIKGQRKIVVGCKDFTQDGGVLHEFSKLCNQVQVDGKSGTTIESVHEIIAQSNHIIDKDNVINKFWDMFVVDTLIGNPDRHFDNWGLLERNGHVSFAPIYDCGSSLAALLDDDKMCDLLSDPVAFKNEEFNLTSCYYFKGKRIFYHEVYQNPPYYLAEATKRVVPNINIERIFTVIDTTPISDIRKKYLKKALNLRYEKILIPALQRIKT